MTSETISIGILPLLRSFWVVTWLVCDNFEFGTTNWPEMVPKWPKNDPKIAPNNLNGFKVTSETISIEILPFLRSLFGAGPIKQYRGNPFHPWHNFYLLKVRKTQGLGYIFAFIYLTFFIKSFESLKATTSQRSKFWYLIALLNLLLCSMINTSENYQRTQQENVLMLSLQALKEI